LKRAALYIRVSTLEQAQEGYSIGAQKERLIAFCKAHDWLIVEFYIDSGYTGSNLDRPGIQKLIAETKNCDLVLVYKLDRLSRSQRDTLYLIEDVFLPNGVDFVSMNESFDTSSPFGRAMIGILSVFAQLEREQIRERTKMGKLARAKEGLWGGGANSAIGYDYIDGHLVVNDYEAVQVRKIYALYLDEMSPAKIAAQLRAEGYTNRYGSWSELSGHTSVLRILCNEVYLGTLRYDDVVVENAHEAIIDRAVFERAAAMREKRHEIYGDSAYQTKYLLVGLLFCAHCGARYCVKHNYKDYKYYVCYSRSRTVKAMIKADHCENKNWRLDELDGVVEGEVRRLLFDARYLKALVKEKDTTAKKQKPRDEADVIRSKVAALEKKIGSLMDLYETDALPIDVLSARIDKLYREKVALSEQLSVIAPAPPKLDYNDDALTGLLADFGAVWDGADEQDKRRIISSLIRRITLDGEKVNIEWSFLQN
jgi:site-specific DNA recombinase